MRTVAVVGAGASGLPAIKSCLDEGLDVTCYERTDDIGGLWNYTESVRAGQACVMKSTVINTSKEMMTYSDYPIPKEYPMYLHNTHVQSYFQKYADHFSLKQHIKFKHEVLSIKQAKDFDTTGRWDMQVKDNKTGKVEDKIFDAVLICTGHHAYPNFATFPGQKDFQGTVVHSHDYKHWAGYENSRTAVVGIGNSGGDAAVELSRVCKQVFLVTRRGSWVFSRIGKQGVPWDMTFLNRSVRAVQKLIPTKFLRQNMEDTLNNKIDHEKYGLKPKHSPMGQHPTANDDLPTRIICGSIKVKPNIKRFTKTGLEFEDGTYEDNIDHVIMATGYVFGFPFLDKSVVEVKDNNVPLYKMMFPPDLSKRTLAIIGCFQPVGALMPVSEMQTRLAVRVFKGSVTLPCKDAMWEEIREKQKALKERYYAASRHTIQVDVIDYTDSLAELVGCKPNFVKLLFTDPYMAYKCFFAPCCPYQYRLQGPGAWPGARNAILEVWDRTFLFMERKSKATKEGLSYTVYVILTLCVLLLACFIRMFWL